MLIKDIWKCHLQNFSHFLWTNKLSNETREYSIKVAKSWAYGTSDTLVQSIVDILWSNIILHCTQTNTYQMGEAVNSRKTPHISPSWENWHVFCGYFRWDDNEILISALYWICPSLTQENTEAECEMVMKVICVNEINSSKVLHIFVNKQV